MSAVTAASGTTVYVFQKMWRGHPVEVCHADHPCDPEHCAFGVMHHYGDDGKHYCPTGYLFCGYCCGIADEPEPYSCTLWEER